jgi:hypothetical protein
MCPSYDAPQEREDLTISVAKRRGEDARGPVTGRRRTGGGWVEKEARLNRVSR